jgi:hypothetical protein
MADGKTISANNSETAQSVSSIANQGTGSFFQNRIILGIEIKIAVVRINAEMVFDPAASITGLSFGFNTAF